MANQDATQAAFHRALSRDPRREGEEGNPKGREDKVASAAVSATVRRQATIDMRSRHAHEECHCIRAIVGRVADADGGELGAATADCTTEAASYGRD